MKLCYNTNENVNSKAFYELFAHIQVDILLRKDRLTMKILVSPDAFKGTIESPKAVKIIRRAAKRRLTEFELIGMPLADGGEGTAELMVNALNGRIETIEIEGPFSKPARAKVGFVDKGRCAIIESAQAIALGLAGKRSNPEKTSSYGVGQMISYATSKGAERIVLALGGSCTNDLGTGMLSAMGLSFVDMCGNRFTPVGKTMYRVENIEYTQAFSKYRDIEFVLMCDVENPLLGENGCAAVFAAQKGADEAGIKRLEDGAVKLSKIMSRVTGTKYAGAPGAGAAGGIGFGAMTFLGAKVKSGIETMFDIYSYSRAVSESNLVITGEGSFDRQSFMGKSVGKVIEYAGAEGKPCVVFCGKYDGTPVPENVTVIPIAEGQSDEEAVENASDNLLAAAEAYFASQPIG